MHQGSEVAGGALSRQALSDMLRLYDAGKMLQAYQRGILEAPLSAWRGKDEEVFAGRLFNHLGAPRRARAFHLRALRSYPADIMVAGYGIRAIAERWGPVAAIEFFNKAGPFENSQPEWEATWLAFRAWLASFFRDFVTADEMIARAIALSPRDPWICVEHSRILEAQDKYDEAFAQIQISLELHPMFRPAVQARAHMLQIMDRDREALAVLEEAAEDFESADVLFQLAQLQDHLNLHADAAATLARIDALCPLPEKRFEQGLFLLRSHVAYHAGKIEDAISCARQADTPFSRKIAASLREQLAKGQTWGRVLLDFPFVRQHHMTCAPATISAISRFWGRAADHLSVVEAICYDGTTSYSQRTWARDHGWITHEFTLSWDAAVALIDRGIPFGLGTTVATSAHMQAVIGYDSMRRTILCRDPYQYYITEFSLDLLLEYNAASGTRAMLMIPPEQESLLAGIPFPDADLHDLLHEVEAGLARYDRTAAAAAHDKLSAAAPNHRTTLHARRALAQYDGDLTRLLEALDALLALGPKDQAILLAKIYCLRAMERRDLLRPLLEKAVADPESDPIFHQLSADELKADMGITDRGIRLLRRALRRKPHDTSTLFALADAWWSRRNLEKATQLYLLGASVSDKNESAQRTYFTASRHLRQTDRVLAMLRQRFEHWGARSGGPGTTLFWAFEALDRLPEAFETLEKALALRPDDGDLLLFAADAFGRRSHLDRAAALLEAASNKARRAAWLRTAAQLALYEGKLTRALELWREVLAAEPLANDANDQVAHLIAETESRAAAYAHLRSMKERFPQSTHIAQLLALWLRDEGPTVAEPVARELAERCPGNVWARIELSSNLVHLARPEEALVHANAAAALSPSHPGACQAIGDALRGLKRNEEAQEAYRQAIRVSVDFTSAIFALVKSAPDGEGRRMALEFVHQELVGQVIFGDGLLAYCEVASGILDPAELLANLRAAHAARPELWHVWSALAQHLTRCNLLDEALSTAREAAHRFPLLPRAWVDLSEVQRVRGDRDDRIESLRHALQLSPAWSMAARRLAEALEQSGVPDQALDVLDRAIARDPLDAENHHALAHLLWKQRKRPEAIAKMRRAILLNPRFGLAWGALQHWTAGTPEESQTVEFAREVCQKRAGEAFVWMNLARMLPGANALTERLAAAERAVQLSPRNPQSHDLRICLLMESSQIASALAACDPPEFAGKPPIELRGRRAWVLWHKGERKPAVDLLRALIEEFPDYHWGWNLLVTWLAENKNDPLYLEIAGAMARQFPHDVTALNNLAHALIANDRRIDAVGHLNRALQIAPANEYAAVTLFRLHLNSKDFAAASALLPAMQQHLPPAVAASRRVMLAAAQKNADQARSLFRTLCEATDDNTFYLDEALAALEAAKLGIVAEEVFARITATNPAVDPKLVERWGHLVGVWPEKTQRILASFKAPTPQWTAAATAHINTLAASRKFPALRRFLRKQKAALLAQTPLWGVGGYALFAMADHRGCIRWLSDWRSRTDAKPWMLLNLVHALRHLGRDAQARTVGEAAVGLREDHATLKHLVWLAMEETAAGALGPHTQRYRKSDCSKLDRHFPFLCNLIDALIPVCGPTTGDKAGLSRNACHALELSTRRYPRWQKSPELRRMLRRAARRIACWHPTLLTRLWSLKWTLASFFPGK